MGPRVTSCAKPVAVKTKTNKKQAPRMFITPNRRLWESIAFAMPFVPSQGNVGYLAQKVFLFSKSMMDGQRRLCARETGVRGQMGPG
jgi:hypothetical protein